MRDRHNATLTFAPAVVDAVRKWIFHCHF
jgi:hypothetical protein